MKLLEDSDGFPQMEQDEPKAQRFLQWMWYDVMWIRGCFMAVSVHPMTSKLLKDVEPPKVG